MRRLLGLSLSNLWKTIDWLLLAVDRGLLVILVLLGISLHRHYHLNWLSYGELLLVCSGFGSGIVELVGRSYWGLLGKFTHFRLRLGVFLLLCFRSILTSTSIAERVCSHYADDDKHDENPEPNAVKHRRRFL